jgi:plasmid stability protein
MNVKMLSLPEELVHRLRAAAKDSSMTEEQMREVLRDSLSKVDETRELPLEINAKMIEQLNQLGAMAKKRINGAPNLHARRHQEEIFWKVLLNMALSDIRASEEFLIQRTEESGSPPDMEAMMMALAGMSVISRAVLRMLEAVTLAVPEGFDAELLTSRAANWLEQDMAEYREEKSKENIFDPEILLKIILGDDVGNLEVGNGLRQSSADC